MNANWIKYLPGFVRTKLEGRYGLQAIVSNSGWLLSDKILRMGVGLLVGVWIARYLGPEQFGLLNFTNAIAALFGVFATLGLDGIVIRELVINPDCQKQLLGSAFALKLIGGLIALLLSVTTIIIMQDGEPLTLWLVGISAAGFIFQSVNVIEFHFQSKIKSKYTVISANAAFTLITVLKIYLLLKSAPLIAFAWAGLSEVGLTMIFLMIAYKLNHQNIRNWKCDMRVMKELIQECWPLILAGLAVMLYMRIDVVMLQQMVGAREVGIYSAATRISEVWYFLPSIIVASVSPSIIRSHNNNPDQYLQRMRQLYFTMGWLGIGVALPLSFFSRIIVGSLFGSEFESSAPVLSIHLWASIAVFLGVASSQHLLVEKLQKISLFRTLIGLTCNVILNLLLIPTMGAKGAAVATVIAYFLATFSLIFFKETRAHSIYLAVSLFKRN